MDLQLETRSFKNNSEPAGVGFWIFLKILFYVFGGHPLPVRYFTFFRSGRTVKEADKYMIVLMLDQSISHFCPVGKTVGTSQRALEAHFFI